MSFFSIWGFSLASREIQVLMLLGSGYSVKLSANRESGRVRGSWPVTFAFLLTLTVAMILRVMNSRGRLLL